MKHTLLNIIEIVFTIYMIMLFARILSSWIPEMRDHPIMKWVGEYTDPYLNFFKQYIPPLGMIDLSPIVAFISLSFLEYTVEYLVKLLFR